MCGIAGTFVASAVDAADRLAAVKRVTDALSHRGPDAGGLWIDRDAGVAFGHRRLAIVDLSDAGSQPMQSHSGRLVATYNGEIYNFGDLRSQLEEAGYSFSGGSDTEVMLAACEHFGIQGALSRFAGMFALGLWDRPNRVLHLVRDRMGKKPLYVGLIKNALVFASELKAFLAFPGFEPEIDPDAVAAMLRFGWVPDQHCIWKNVFKLPPGTMLSVRKCDIQNSTIDELQEKIRPWWSLEEVAREGQVNPLDLNENELVEELDRLLGTAVRERMVADVPLGAFLSGGVDSSTVVALMQAQSQKPVRTFTIGFGEAGYDEATEAARIARHLGTDHTEFRLSPAAASEIIPDLPKVWDEPFADESQIPTLLVSRLARQHVTVVLSGDGGDECFGGYARHVMVSRLAPLFHLPRAMRRTMASATLMLAPDTWNGIMRLAPVSNRWRRTLNGDSLHKLAGVLDAANDIEAYDRVISIHRNSALGLADQIQKVPDLPDPVSRMSYLDMAGYLPDDILVKLDRATMSIGLEARCPLLDHRIVEFAWRVPSAFKVRQGEGKWLLRKVLSRYVPRNLYDRPKQGFNVPIGSWLRGPLRDWAEDLLAEPRLREEGLLDVAHVRACWQEHQSKRRNRSRELWAILMLQAWLDQSKRMEMLPATGLGEAMLGAAES